MRTLFIPFAPSLAHVSRCLAVAEALRKRGHTAVFAIGPERAALVQKAGFETHGLPEVSSAVFRSARGFQWLSPDYFAQNLAAEKSIVSDTKPAAVVFDFRFTTALAAHQQRCPAIGLLHGNALGLALHPKSTARLLIGNPKGARGLSALRVLFLRQLFPIAFQFMLRRVARRLNPVLKAEGRPPIHSPFELLIGDASLVADLPELLLGDLPAHCNLVGPLMWSGWEQAAPWLDQFDEHPLVYVTMGSTVEAQSILLKIIEALSDAPYNVVVSTGNLALSVEPEPPPNIRIFSTVPGAAVVQRSTIVIHHGGHETLMQVLAAGVPSLVFPANPDQILVAQQVESLGLGHSFWKAGRLPTVSDYARAVTSTEIRQAVDRLMLDNRCRQTCAVFRDKINSAHGATQAAEAIERLAVG